MLQVEKGKEGRSVEAPNIGAQNHIEHLINRRHVWLWHRAVEIPCEHRHQVLVEEHPKIDWYDRRIGKVDHVQAYPVAEEGPHLSIATEQHNMDGDRAQPVPDSQAHIA